MKNHNTPSDTKPIRIENPNVAKAKEILRGTKAKPAELLALAKKLKEINSFNRSLLV